MAVAPVPRWRPRWLGAALIGVLGCSGSKPKPDEPEVKALHIEGTQHVSEGELKDKILTAASSWWPFAERHYFDANAWQADLRRIVRAYQAEGYYNAKILENQIIPKSQDAIELKVRMEEGPPTHIQKIWYGGFAPPPPPPPTPAPSPPPVKPGQVFQERPSGTAPWDVTSKVRGARHAP